MSLKLKTGKFALKAWTFTPRAVTLETKVESLLPWPGRFAPGVGMMLSLFESSRFPPWALLTERSAPEFRTLAPKTKSFARRAEMPNVSLKPLTGSSAPRAVMLETMVEGL